MEGIEQHPIQVRSTEEFIYLAVVKDRDVFFESYPGIAQNRSEAGSQVGYALNVVLRRTPFIQDGTERQLVIVIDCGSCDQQIAGVAAD